MKHYFQCLSFLMYGTVNNKTLSHFMPSGKVRAEVKSWAMLVASNSSVVNNKIRHGSPSSTVVIHASCAISCCLVDWHPYFLSCTHHSRIIVRSHIIFRESWFTWEVMFSIFRQKRSNFHNGMLASTNALHISDENVNWRLEEAVSYALLIVIGRFDLFLSTGR